MWEMDRECRCDIGKAGLSPFLRVRYSRALGVVNFRLGSSCFTLCKGKLELQL